MILAGLSWLAGKAMALLGSKIVRGAIDIYNKVQAGEVRLAEINARTGEVITVTAIEAGTGRQQAKMNWPVFWVIIGGMMLWPFVTLGAITLYNIFWWENGIWPQTWAIAAYPPSVAPWVQASIDWLYDPVGPPLGVGSALLAAHLTRR